MKHTQSADDAQPRIATARTVYTRVACCATLGLIALIGTYASDTRAEEKAKVDPWCKVIAQQIDRNRDEGLKPHDSVGSERLREERRRLDKDAHDRHCNGR